MPPKRTAATTTASRSTRNTITRTAPASPAKKKTIPTKPPSVDLDESEDEVLHKPFPTPRKRRSSDCTEPAPKRQRRGEPQETQPEPSSARRVTKIAVARGRKIPEDQGEATYIKKRSTRGIPTKTAELKEDKPKRGRPSTRKPEPKKAGSESDDPLQSNATYGTTTRKRVHSSPPLIELDEEGDSELTSPPPKPPIKKRTRKQAPSPIPESDNEVFTSEAEAERPPQPNLQELSPGPSSYLSSPPLTRAPSPAVRTNSAGGSQFNWTPPELKRCLDLQKHLSLQTLARPPHIALPDNAPNTTTACQLTALLQGTIERCEGNSCILLGSRASGKTSVVDSCLESCTVKPIIIRLSGYIQQTDRQAMREISAQLCEQTGTTFLQDDEAQEANDEQETDPAAPIFVEPLTSQLPSLISVIPTLARPTVVVIDAFDLFTLHARQALLYCLLDTAQSIRAGSSKSGMAVIGLTSRIDTISLLEKRVKSRFSGRVFRTEHSDIATQWTDVTRAVLCPSWDGPDDEGFQHWSEMWNERVEKFIEDRSTRDAILETYAISKDVKVWMRILTSILLRLDVSHAWPTVAMLKVSAEAQRTREIRPSLNQLTYASLALLVASKHAAKSGYPVVTFEMLHEYFREQVRASAAAPVQLGGAGIGIRNCSRGVLASEFENLVSARIFAPAGSTVGTPKEFVKYRCTVDPGDVKYAIMAANNVPLKKWFDKG
ncbi:hypothetical protein CYLTODRAFT_386184 [Cylindrobasidium torrendii FP15055 ss-10]|uniref:Uncharacterized protein n=1 Tax=Cylindrobasidium torrendii FP15055 ss-10 TaxID=1314674 RepID=A0A0D7BSU8_9AGAR|nr:hypothetical protein CYLTODRAFT_386184 [Cylindrobasidium torrendii FP15055 ss-10]